MAKGGQQQSGQNDESLSPLWISIALVVTALALWYFASDYIVMFVLKIKLSQAYFIALFTDALNFDIRWMKNVDPSTVEFFDLQEVSTLVGKYTRYPYIFVMLIFALILYMSKSAKMYRNTYTMKKLAKEEQLNWPYLTPVVGLDLIKQDINKGPWAMGLTPMQFAKKYNLVVQQEEKMTDKAVNRRKRIQSKLLRNPAKKVFIQQLGSYWTGIESLPPHTKALFAAFAAKANHDSAGAAKLLTQIALSAGTGKSLDYTGVDALLKKYANARSVEKVVGKHAYVFTVMAAMIALARLDGVQATADFMWLKPIDRRLWYTLNSVGRQTPYAEAAGIFAHWLAEKEFGAKLYVPMVDEAVNGLEIALKEIVYQIDE